MIKYRNAFHYVAGAIAGWLVIIIPIAGLALMLSFMAYEVCQDWRKKDWSFRDILEFVIAYFVASTLALILYYTGVINV